MFMGMACSESFFDHHKRITIHRNQPMASNTRFLLPRSESTTKSCDGVCFPLPHHYKVQMTKAPLLIAEYHIVLAESWCVVGLWCTSEFDLPCLHALPTFSLLQPVTPQPCLLASLHTQPRQPRIGVHNNIHTWARQSTARLPGQS